MTHDEMCPRLTPTDCPCSCRFASECYHHCQCDLIRKVRDTQREQDAKTVERVSNRHNSGVVRIACRRAAKEIREGK